jgi:hypothetical protein
VRLGSHAQGGGSGLHAAHDDATDGRALKGEVLVDGTGAGGSAGDDPIDTDATGGDLGVGAPCHAPQCSRSSDLG